MNLCKHWQNTMFTTGFKTIQPVQNTQEIVRIIHFRYNFMWKCLVKQSSWSVKYICFKPKQTVSNTYYYLLFKNIWIFEYFAPFEYYSNISYRTNNIWYSIRLILLGRKIFYIRFGPKKIFVYTLAHSRDWSSSSS